MEEAKYIPGDLIIYTSLIKEPVAEICEVNEASYLIRFANGNFARVTSKEIKPIPLTPEILEKNGWTKQTMIINEYGDEQSFFTRDDMVDIYMVKDENGYYFLLDACVKCNMDIYFVHQLQHLLFGLGLDSSLKV